MGRDHAYVKPGVDVESGVFDAVRPLPDLYSSPLSPAGCSPVAAELNHCEHGRHSLFTCGLSPAAAQPGFDGHLFVTQKGDVSMCVCK